MVILQSVGREELKGKRKKPGRSDEYWEKRR